jgi:hypothetical protein
MRASGEKENTEGRIEVQRTACCLDEQRTVGERRVVAACWCTLPDWWLLLVLVLREQRSRED